MYGIIKRISTLVFAFSFIWSGIALASDSGVSIKVGSMSTHNRAIVATAAQTLFDYCPGLAKHIRDIDAIKASVHSVGVDRLGSNARILKWNHWVTFEVITDKDFRQLPAPYTHSPHHMYYDLGGAPQPGIVVAKNFSAQFCPDMPENKDYPDLFISVPELVLVDELQIEDS